MTTYLFDNNMSPRLAKAMAAALTEFGEDVRHLKDHFAADVKDVVFIPKIASDGWVLITFDAKILSRPLERKAVSDSGLVAVFLAESIMQLDPKRQYGLLVSNWDNINEAVAGARLGRRLFQFTVQGKVKPITT